ncbi:uncharacterized protein [Procambarus clarkii]|uniref:uncharacterized protein n=1 Tax=Procambarus clarkii TaxID=6728 RepID=UPI001E67001E|nr:uncharacterized protein LOC123760885 [Procambarus clarkii]XP_045602643.1 uncharacterized protein LOC123760885 [Procambarus clarkii]XP_045602644.1 uncharacterized protein LOC123760885 [Procambarus clarkii]
MMAPFKKEKDVTSKVELVRRLHSKLTQEVAQMRNYLGELEKKNNFLQAEALRHQVELSSDYPHVRILGPKEEKQLKLDQEHVEFLQKRLEIQKLISLNTILKSNVAVKQIEGMDEGLEEESRHNKDTRSSVIISDANEKGVLKLWSIEGTVGKHMYSTNFLANYSVKSPGGKIINVEDLHLSSGSDIIKKLLQPPRDLQPSTLQQFTADLYFFQILCDEREETVSQLENDIDGLVIERELEPMVLTFFPTEEHEIKILWKIVWDSRNNRLKYNIFVSCEDDVAIRYSSSKEVYPFLSGKKLLQTREEVADFVNAFLDL